MKKLSIILLVIVALLFAFTGCAKPVSSAAGSQAQSAVSSAVSLPTLSSSASSSTPSSASFLAGVSSSSASSTPVVTSSDTAVSSSEQQAQTVSVTIDGTKGGGKTYDFTVDLQDGDTVFTVLQRVCANNKILISYQKGPSVYIQALAGIGLTTATSGWIYSVNNDFPDKGCDKYPVKAEDNVLWVYTLDMGKTEGAGQ